MKKLTSLLCFAALGMFAVGCEETGTVVDEAPAPDMAPDAEGGSLEGDAAMPEDEVAPPMTNEVPPTLPAGEDAALDEPALEETTPPAPEPAEPTTETPPAPAEPAGETAEPAAEAEAEATPAPEGEAAPQE